MKNSSLRNRRLWKKKRMKSSMKIQNLMTKKLKQKMKTKMNKNVV